MASEEKQSFTVGGFYGAKNKRKWIGLERSIDSTVKKHKSEKIPKTFPSRILGPSLKWQTFFRQQDAFIFSRHSAKDLHVFAFESKTFEGNSGQRMYLVASYPVFWHYYSQLSQDQKHHYEVIPEGAVCKLYFDLEYDVAMNPGCLGDQMVRILIQYVCRALTLEFNMTCAAEDVLDLDASTERKFSRHLIFQMKKAAFKDNIHAGRFVMFLMSQLVSYVQMACPELDTKQQTESHTDNREDCEPQLQQQITDNRNSHSEKTAMLHGESSNVNSVVEDNNVGNKLHDACSVRVGNVGSDSETSSQRSCKHCTESGNGASDTVATTSTYKELSDAQIVVNERAKIEIETTITKVKTEETVAKVNTEKTIANVKSEETIANVKSEETIANVKSEETIANVKLKETIAKVKSEETIENVKSEETVANVKSEETIAKVKMEETAAIDPKNSLSALEAGSSDNEADSKNILKEKIKESSGDIECTSGVQLIDEETGADESKEVVDKSQRYRELLERYTVEELKMMIVKNKNGENTLFCDTGVYTKNRNFRLYQSSKLGKNNPLKLSAHNKYQKQGQDQEIFFDSLIANVQYSRTLKILTFSKDTDRGCQLGNISRSKRERTGKESIDGYHKSPYPEVDEYIMSLITQEAAQGVIRHWTYFHEGELLLFEIARYRYCHNVARQHRSNNIMYVVDLRKGVFYQKCHDPDCYGQNYKSQEWPLPRDVLPESYFDDDFDPADEDMDDEELLNTTMEIERKHLQGNSATDESLFEDSDDDDELVAAANALESNLYTNENS